MRDPAAVLLFVLAVLVLGYFVGWYVVVVGLLVAVAFLALRRIL